MTRQSSNGKIVDPFLLRVLEQHRGQDGFTDILRSIQDEQNKIVDYDFRKNVVVQGCAGSGKTMILFHRLANILYHLDEIKIKQDKIAVIIPNNDFRQYIAELAWSLGVNKIRMFTMDEYLLAKLDRVLIGIFRTEIAEMIVKNNREREKNTRAELIKKIRKNLVKDLAESKQIESEKDIEKKLKDFIKKYKKKYKAMVRKRDEERNIWMDSKKPAYDKEYARWRRESLEKIRDFREESMEQFVEKFFGGKYDRNYLLRFFDVLCSDRKDHDQQKDKEKQQLNEPSVRGLVIRDDGDDDDNALWQYAPSADELLMIDEGQDYGFYEYETLNKMNPRCIYNIYGDIDQKIFDRGVEEWNGVRELLKADYFELNQDYRNSEQIVDFVNRTFDKDMLSVGYSTKDVEEVPLRKLPVYLEYEKKILNHKIAIISEVPDRYRKFEKVAEIMRVEEIKGLEFDTVFVSPEVEKMKKNFRYVSYTRALDHLYLLKKAQ